MSNIFIIEPTATENEVPSPSFEDPDNALADITTEGASVTRSLERARFGRASAKVVTSNILAAEGIRYTLDPSASAEPRACSVYVRGAGSVRMRVLDFTNTLQFTGEPIQLNDIFWQRLEVVMTLGAVTCTDLRVFVETPDESQAITFFVDGFQVEAQGFVTDYVDGDLEKLVLPHRGEPWFKWTATINDSRSTRSGRYRRAGRPIKVTQGLYSELWPTNITGFGMPPIRTNVLPFTDLEGLQVQQQKAQSRVLGMTFFASKDPDEEIGIPADLRPLHIAREALERVIKPDLVQETQPVMIEYQNRRARMRIPSYYEGGLEFQGDIRFPYQNSFSVRFLTEDPFWTVDSQDVCDLAISDSDNVAHLAARINGEWKMFECNGFVQVIEVDPATNEIWVGGSFTTIDAGAGAVTVNRVCKISADGNTITPVGQGPGVDDGTVFAIAFRQDGQVFVGGSYVDIDGATMNNISQFDPVTDAFLSMDAGPGVNGDVRALAVDRNELLYLGGDFTDEFGGGNTINRIAQFETSSGFVALVGANGNGVNSTVRGMTIDLDGLLLFFCGAFTQETGAGADTLKRVASWDNVLNVFVQLSLDGSEETVQGICIDNAGNLYAAGLMTNIGFNDVDKVAFFNRQEWYPLGVAGEGVTGGIDARCCHVRQDGLVVFGGDFTGATGVKSGFVNELATWDGFRFGFMDINLPGVVTIIACKWNGQDLWIGGEFPFAGAPGEARFSSIQTCVNNGRAKSSPILEILGPADVAWLENQTTGQLVRFELEVKEGETVTANLTPGHQSVVSDVRGNIIQDLLPESDPLHLLPGDNKIAYFSLFTGVNAEEALRWPIRAWSFDD